VMTDQTKASAPPQWAYLPFQITITAAALVLFNQAVFAGQFLAGTFGSLHAHRENATYAGISVLLAAACAVLVRWPGQGPLWPLLACPLRLDRSGDHAWLRQSARSAHPSRRFDQHARGTAGDLGVAITTTSPGRHNGRGRTR
jgi:hypothetical protein